MSDISVSLSPPATHWIIIISRQYYVGYYNTDGKFIRIRTFDEWHEAMSFYSSVAPNKSKTTYHRIDIFTFECGYFNFVEKKWNPVHITSTEEEAISFCHQANLKTYSAA